MRHFQALLWVRQSIAANFHERDCNHDPVQQFHRCGLIDCGYPLYTSQHEVAKQHLLLPYCVSSATVHQGHNRVLHPPLEHKPNEPQRGDVV